MNHLWLAAVIASLALLLVACGDDEPSAVTAAVTATTSAGGAASSSTSLAKPEISPESAALTRELKRTAQQASVLAGQLEQERAPRDDPRVGLLFGIRARSQALIARRALVEGQPSLADQAARQLELLLARGRGTAAPEVADSLIKAQNTLDALIQPSTTDRKTAESVLGQATQDLSPLLTIASSIVSTSGSTASTSE